MQNTSEIGHGHQNRNTENQTNLIPFRISEPDIPGEWQDIESKIVGFAGAGFLVMFQLIFAAWGDFPFLMAALSSTVGVILGLGRYKRLPVSYPDPPPGAAGAAAVVTEPTESTETKIFELKKAA